MARFGRLTAATGLAAALACTTLIGTGTAYASTGFNTHGDVSQVTGTASISGSHLTLTNVKLYDLSCDNRAAEYWVETNHGSYPHHNMPEGCKHSHSFGTVSGTDGGTISWLRVNTRACNSTGCSSTQYGVHIYP